MSVPGIVALGVLFVTAAAASATTLAVGARPAFAQSGSGQELYDVGVQAYGAKDYDTACAKFAQSYQAEQAAAALFMLGKCERARGKLVVARGHFLKVVETEMQDAKMVEHARTEAAELAGIIPRVTLRLAPSAPATSTITLDGKAVRAESAIEVDPGSHDVTITAAGHEPSSRKISLAERQVIELEVSPGKKSGADVGSAGASVEGSTPDGGGSSAVRTAGIVVTSVGAALAATAIVTSVWIAAGCSGESEGNAFGCPREGDGYASPYGALMPINAIGWIGGVVGLGVGIPLLIVGGSGGSSDDVAVVVTPSGAVLRGRF